MEVQDISTVETVTVPKGNDDNAQAATIEQLEATKMELATTMQALEDIKLAQSGSDKTVAKLMAKLEEKETVKKTAEQRIEAIELKAAASEARAVRQEWLNAGYKEATTRGLPARLIDNYGGDPDKLIEFLDAEKEDRENIKTESVKATMKDGKHVPSGGGSNESVEIANMTSAEKVKHYNTMFEKRLSNQG